MPVSVRRLAKNSVIPLCDNDFIFDYEAAGENSTAEATVGRWIARNTISVAKQTMMHQTHRLLIWVLLLALLAYSGYLSFRAYLSPEFLIGFANLFSC